jgi:hypothetical protein
MRERGISEGEVEEALRNVLAESSARTPGRVNLWGRTDRGRILRVTTYRDDRSDVVTLVAAAQGPR